MYKARKTFPKNVDFGLTSQMRRAVLSITSILWMGSGERPLKSRIPDAFLPTYWGKNLLL
ncbi:MAG: four helix bundle protein [Desulfobacteraceae bacterium]|nr:MAG: four helix bundle protein [Desulfobacteraceae bacterium]